MNIAIIKQSGGKYLFEVPESITLKEGEKVKCDTRRGITDGIVWADSITVDEPAAKLIGKLLGAKFPLKSVVGKTVTSVEMFEQPKQESVKLYCVEADEGCLTKGKIYELGADGKLVYDCCETSGRYKTVDAFFFNYPNWKARLVPLVSRPAKVGEWVYLVEEPLVNDPHHGDGYYVTDYHKGDIAKITAFGIFASVVAKNPAVFAGFRENEYLVLDGYKPEPEYYSGKVVCVEATDRGVTLGKVYSVENGVFTWNNGKKSDTKATTIEQFNNWFIAAKFIEFKGE